MEISSEAGVGVSVGRKVIENSIDGIPALILIEPLPAWITVGIGESNRGGRSHPLLEANLHA